MPLPAGAAGVIATGSGPRLRTLARLLRGECARTDTLFLGFLERRGYGELQCKALAAVTPGAALRLLAQGRALEDFFEQVSYNGRRLAKLDMLPAAAPGLLATYGRLLGRQAARRSIEIGAEARAAAAELGAAIVVGLNNAFFEVREAEIATFFELHEAGLDASSEAGLIESHAAILARFTRAAAACAVLFDGKRLVAGAGLSETASSRMPPAHVFERPLYLGAASGTRCLLEPAWRDRYRSFWSIPLSGAGLSGAVQFAFEKDYPWLPRELRLLTAASARCVALCDKLRLAGRVAAREREIRELAARMLEAEERERRRISRELHDETGQLLPSVRLRLELLERQAPEEPDTLRKGLAEARELLGQAIVEIRRILADLSPAVLEQLGLPSAVRQVLNRVRQEYGLAVKLDISGMGSAPKAAAAVAYRIVQESAANTVRHASATRLNVSLSTADGKLKLRVDDDGVGFRVSEALAKPGSHGLSGMRERVVLAGGRFEVRTSPGRGTRIAATLPAPGASPPGRRSAGRGGEGRRRLPASRQR